MIPTIGILIAAYVSLRCVEIMCFPENRYRSKTSKTIVTVMAYLTMLFSWFCAWELQTSGSKAMEIMR